MDPIKWLEGKKTYATALVILLVGILAYWGLEVPEFVWAALAALGLGFLRAGVNKSGPTKLPFLPVAAALGLSLVLSSGCGVETLSPGQQYDIASSSVRAAVDSLKVAGDNGLIADEDIVAIDPFVKQAFDSLRAMRTEVLQGNSVKTQWYLTQVRQLVAKLLTMQATAKEMHNGGNRSSCSDGDPDGPERDTGPGQGTARGQRRQKAVYARRTCAGRSAQRAERKRVGRHRIRREGPAWHTAFPDPAIASGESEREWD